MAEDRAEIKITLDAKEAEAEATKLQKRVEELEKRAKEAGQGQGAATKPGQPTRPGGSPPAVPVEPTGTKPSGVGGSKIGQGLIAAVALRKKLTKRAKLKELAKKGRSALGRAAVGAAALEGLGYFTRAIATNFENPRIEAIDKPADSVAFAEEEGDIRAQGDQLAIATSPAAALRVAFQVGRLRARAVEDAFASAGDTSAGALVEGPVGAAFEAARVRDEILSSREARRLVTGRNRLGILRRGRLDAAEAAAKLIGGP